MFIQEATIKDLDQLKFLFNSYRVFYQYKEDVAAGNDFLKDRIKQGDSKIFICREEQVIIAFMQLYPLLSSTKMRKVWLLNDLFVDPKHRGRGISKKLIRRAKELTDQSGACGILLETDKNNLIGNALYTDQGFHLNKTSNYYEWEIENVTNKKQ